MLSGDRANAELSTDFCRNQDIVIGGTLFPYKWIDKVVWLSLGNVTDN